MRLGEATLTVVRKQLYKGNVVDLGIEQVQLPNSKHVELEIVRHPGGAAIVALNDQQQICMINQYRHAAGGWLWEIPAGKIDHGEKASFTAQRELEEEVGLQAKKWLSIGPIVMTPGFCDEVIHLFIAKELSTVSTRRGQHEVMESHWIDFSTALDWAHEGKIYDAKTLVALYKTEKYLRDDNIN